MTSIRKQLSATPLRPLLLRWRHSGLKPADAFLASYPKSGNTWLRHMLVHLLTGAEHDFLGGRDRLIPYVGRHGGQQNLRCPSGGRLLKTHELYRPSYRKAIYVARDARDVVISNYWFQRRQQGEEFSFEEFVVDFVNGKINPYGPWQDHVSSWVNSPLWDSADLLFIRYEDLRGEPTDSMAAICEFLSIDVGRAKIEAVVEANSFSSMKRREQQNARMTGIKQSTGVSFVRKGVVGQWREVLSETQLKLLDDRCGAALSSLGYPRFSSD